MIIGRRPGVATGVVGASVGASVAVIEVAEVVDITPTSMLWLMREILTMGIMMRLCRRCTLRRWRKNL